jgi:hypothetical protein
MSIDEAVFTIVGVNIALMFISVSITVYLIKSRPVRSNKGQQPRK